MAIVSNTVEKLLLAAPRGYCAGVDRAVQTVERALELHGAPVYVRKEIVHNKHVVEQLRERGAIFVDERDRGARGRGVRVLRARRRAERARGRERARPADDRRDLPARDEGPPRGASASPRDGYTIVLVGHDGHEEVEGTMGEAPDRIVLVQNEAGRRRARDRGPRARRLHHADDARRSTKRARSSRACASASRRSSGRAPTTSATRRPTARRPSSRWRASATCCS